MANTVVINGASIDLTKVLCDAGMHVESCRHDLFDHAFSLVLGDFELYDFVITLPDGRPLTIPKLYVKNIKLTGKMLPVLAEDGKTVMMFKYDGLKNTYIGTEK